LQAREGALVDAAVHSLAAVDDLRDGEVDGDAHEQIGVVTTETVARARIPLLVVFKDGQEVDRVVGAVPAAQLREAVERNLAPAGSAAGSSS
jgi:thioredoxin-like negative regulator of GroEL